MWQNGNRSTAYSWIKREYSSWRLHQVNKLSNGQDSNGVLNHDLNRFGVWKLGDSAKCQSDFAVDYANNQYLQHSRRHISVHNSLYRPGEAIEQRSIVPTRTHITILFMWCCDSQSIYVHQVWIFLKIDFTIL